MNYLLMICAGEEREASPARMGIEQWVEQADAAGTRLLGRALDSPETAVTVRVREGETLLSDGPFIESKEYVGGFDVVDCGDLDEALRLAADHPVAAFGAVEVRPFLADFSLPTATRDWARDEPGDSWALLVGVDGQPVGDPDLPGRCRVWDERQAERGTLVFAQPLADAASATTVRLIEGEAVLTDGPFAESKEFVGGLVILRGVDRDEAVGLAAGHPLATHRAIEVRAFVP